MRSLQNSGKGVNNDATGMSRPRQSESRRIDWVRAAKVWSVALISTSVTLVRMTAIAGGFNRSMQHIRVKRTKSLGQLIHQQVRHVYRLPLHTIGRVMPAAAAHDDFVCRLRPGPRSAHAPNTPAQTARTSRCSPAAPARRA